VLILIRDEAGEEPAGFFDSGLAQGGDHHYEKKFSPE
jgi:hypothetical protein